MHKTKTTKVITGCVLAVLTATSVVMPVAADTFDDQIKALQSQIADYQSQESQLKSQENTLQNELASLDAQQRATQAQIQQKQVELQQLQAEIDNDEQRITNIKQALSDNLKSIYIEGNVTPLELVASSKGLGDYIDKQVARDGLQRTIQQSLTSVRKLEADLKVQQAAAQKNLADQQAMSANLATQQSAKAQLIAATQGQEAAYQTLVAQNNNQITSLRAQQAAANLKWSGGNVNFQPRGGGYPSFWADPAMDSLVDDWGMYNRECVSYAAFRVAASGRHMPYWGGQGNAIQWPGDARADGIPVSASPKTGDVAIWPVGYYGHAMYVEAVNDDGSILISEYNYDWTGRYSSRTVSENTYETQGFKFIHF